jgi:putative hemolysin
MKGIVTVTIILLVLTACAAPGVQSSGSVATETVPAGIPNPASVYCEQNGNKLEVVTAADGSQSGRCVFPGGSTCEEWAYYRGECAPVAAEGTGTASSGNSAGPTPGSSIPSVTTEEVIDWWGVIKSTEPGAQFDDYFERQDLGQIMYFGIDSEDLTVKSQIETLRDSGRTVHLYGTLINNVPDYNGSQILVDRIELE